MAKTIEQLKAQGAEVKNATVVGENTATRVGTLFTDIVEHVEEYEAGQAQAIIFDVSSHNDDAVFESLSALLSSSNIDTLIPTSVRHGGMTIRFIQGSEQGSDNKYVQWRCVTQEFSANPEDWVFTGGWRVVENPEFVKVYLDTDNKIIKAIRNNGTEFFAVGVDTQTLKVADGAEVHGDIQTDGSEITTIESLEFSAVWLNKDNKILFGLQKDNNFLFGAGVPRQIIGYVEKRIGELGLERVNDMADFLGSLTDKQPIFSNKKVSIIGDSISTFAGYIPDGYPSWYPHENDRSSDVTSVNDTWWKKLIDATDSTLEVNVSYSGSTASSLEVGFSPRVSLLGSPDVIFIALGTNDSANDVEIGDIDFNADYYDLTKFAPAYIKGIQDTIKTYPNVRIICLAFDMGVAYQNAIKNIANYYALDYIYVGDISDVHPNKAEMQVVYNRIYNTWSLSGVLSGKVSKEKGKSLIDEEVAGSLHYTENPEYIDIELDRDNKILGGRKNDGKKFEAVGFETPNLSINGVNVETFDDPEGRMNIGLDGDKKVIHYHDKDGVLHEVVGIGTPRISTDELILSSEGLNTLKGVLIASGLNIKLLVDWSDKSFINIPVPRHAWVNVICNVPKSNINKKSGFGTAGVNCDVPAMLEFWDMQGNYFKKPILLSAQGDSSMNYYIKNFGFDFDDGTEVKFGNWVAQDSFHLKKYYQDVFRGQCIVGYRFSESLYKTRPTGARRPWNKITTSIGLNPNTPAGSTYDARLLTGSGNDKFDLNTAALTHPDGFSFTMFWNGVEVYDEDKEYTLDSMGWSGIYVWSLKKNRKNYNMDKKDYSAIILDGGLIPRTIWNGTVDWTAFEIRNPKTMHYVAYENLSAETKAAIDNGKIKKYIKVGDVKYYEYSGDYPDEIIGFNIDGVDKDGNAVSDKKTKITTAAIERLSGALATINAEVTTEAKKVKFEEYFDVDYFIDYIIITEVLYHYDGLAKNWIWCTWDSLHWCPTVYDMDSIFGASTNGCYTVPKSSYDTTVETNVWKTIIEDIYRTELEARYAELRNIGVLTTKQICNILKDWMDSVGYEEYKNELDYCKKLDCEIPSYRDGGVNTNWVTASHYSYVALDDENYYDPTRRYVFGDLCLIRYKPEEDAGAAFICVAPTSQDVSPVSDINDYVHTPRFLGFFNSIERIKAWLDKRISVLDTFYHYSN